jgi:shikimate kinase
MRVSYPIIVTGFMGSGKTTVAQALAHIWQCEMIDLDRLITERTGRNPKQIIEQDGEPAFRQVETSLLSEVLKGGGAQVIALGGGAWTMLENRLLIAEHLGQSVWLDVPFEVCWQRITGSVSERPLARDREQARNLYDRRKPIYALAALRVAGTDTLSGAETASRIANELAQSGFGREKDCPARQDANG